MKGYTAMQDQFGSQLSADRYQPCGWCVGIRARAEARTFADVGTVARRAGSMHDGATLNAVLNIDPQTHGPPD